MKKLTIIVALLLALSMLTGCSLLENLHLPFDIPFLQTQPQAPEEPICGGVTDNTDPDAPKQIDSTELTRFYCYFSTTTFVEPGALGRRTFTMSAELQNGAVQGSLHVEGEGGMEREFTADASFMDELQDVAYDGYDMAQYNGRYHSVAGLPEDFGATLEADYASGEKIRAYDNQDNYLSIGFMEALFDLFTQACATEPTVLTVEAQTLFLDTSAGYVSYPAVTVLTEDCEALEEALACVNEQEADYAEAAVKRLEEGKGDLYYESLATVTRSDSEYVSFYVKTVRFEDESWDEPMTEYRGYTVETATGRLLGFSDILRDMDLMPVAIQMEISHSYPDAELYGAAGEYLKTSVKSDDGNVCFALTYGHVHVFVNEYTVCDMAGGQHLLLSFIDYPHLLHALFMTEPSGYIVPVDYGLSYKLGDSFHELLLTWSIDEETYEGKWMCSFCEKTLAEDYFGYAPDCRLILQDGYYYLYTRVPTGDVSMLTDVVALTGDEGPLEMGQIALALRSDGCCDPEQMKMDMNTIIYTAATPLLPGGFFRVGEDGMPEQTSDVCTLSGSQVVLKQSGRYNPADREDAAVSGGMWNLAAGEVLTPLQTDMESFIDFITEDGRVVRFSIDGFSDDMQLDNFGTMDDVFASIYD